MGISELTVQELSARVPGLELRRHEPMRRHCSFRIGGPCAAMALPSSIDETQALCAALREMELPYLVMGNGTNLLVTDAPLERIVVKMGEGMADISRDGEAGLCALCGATLTKLANTALQHGLTGLEFAHGIPGTLGGAVCMNAGAYGGEMKDVVTQTMFLNGDLELQGVSGEQHDFGYRSSMFSDGDYVVLGCELALRPGDPAEIRARMQELQEKRRASQPLEKPSGGSTFKRPKEGYAAALIDQAGLKGYAVGGAQVSEKHAGFVVNNGGATFDDVLRVMDHVQETVFRRTGIRLEPELKIIRG